MNYIAGYEGVIWGRGVGLISRLEMRSGVGDVTAHVHDNALFLKVIERGL